MLSLNKMMGLMLVIVIGLIFILGLLTDDGILPKIKDTTLNTLDIDAGFGMQEVVASEVTISQTHKNELAILQADIAIMMSEGSQINSFHNWGGFSPFDDGFGLILTNVTSGTNVKVYGGAGGIQDYQQFTIEGMRLCVIGGSKAVTSNFYEYFIKPGDTVLSGKYYQEVQQIIITTKNKKENQINYGTGPKDFKGNEWLFTPDKEYICFFPTEWYLGTKCEGGGAVGLDSDCFDDEQGDTFSGEEKTTIPYRVRHSLINSPGHVAEGEVVEEKPVRSRTTAPATAVPGSGSAKVY